MLWDDDTVNEMPLLRNGGAVFEISAIPTVNVFNSQHHSSLFKTLSSYLPGYNSVNVYLPSKLKTDTELNYRLRYIRGIKFLQHTFSCCSFLYFVALNT